MTTTIFLTLFIGQPLARLLEDQNVRAVFFSFGMLLVGIAIAFHAVKSKPDKFELSVTIGLVGVYSFFVLRLGMPERSHLLEYSVLAILVHKALQERAGNPRSVWKPALLAILISFSIGVFDECLQIFIPDRVFDPEDIVFNGSAATTAVVANLIVTGVRRWRKKPA